MRKSCILGMQVSQALEIPETLGKLLHQAPIVALLLLILWAGHKKFWYWGPGVRAHCEELKAARDEWRDIALALLRESGIKLPESTHPGAVADLLKQKNGEGL